MTEPLNLYDLAVEGDDSAPPGYRARSASFGPSIGAERLGGTVYELDPGESVCPYHYENTEEEWLLVLTGTPTLRDPQGEHELAPGDLVCFVLGPDGAHKVTNRSDTVVRILMLSTIPETRIPGSNDRISITVYPDSDKVGVWPPGKRFRLSAENVDYWDGEI
ncbi:MAG: cupin domain-containing protein [Actinomycetota bacterium]|nr:cupin domain-containing protein [Actinomycetota bacterium]